jgi:hypothetical protein
VAFDRRANQVAFALWQVEFDRRANQVAFALRAKLVAFALCANGYGVWEPGDS